MTSLKRSHLPGISPRAWEHPADRAALIALQKIPGLDIALRTLVGATTERSLRLHALASSVRVSERQYPKLHQLLCEACNILDAQYIPELYVAQSPFFNAGAVGVDKPFITLNTSILDIAGSDEALAIIAHELGHCLSGHVLYKTLLQLLLRASVSAVNLPLTAIVLAGVVYALREWDRKSELSADRAGLLAVQNPETSYTILVKMAGAKRVEDIDLNEFFAQAADYRDGGSFADGVYKIINTLDQTHPFPVLRLTELKSWVDSGEYGKILAGNYARRDDATNAKEAFYEAGRQYKHDVAESKNSVDAAVHSVVDAASAAAGKAKDLLGTVFGGG